MNEKDSLRKLLEGTKEDAPVPVSIFKEFVYGHFLHLQQQVSFITKLLWFILSALIVASIANKIF